MNRATNALPWLLVLILAWSLGCEDEAAQTNQPPQQNAAPKEDAPPAPEPVEEQASSDDEEYQRPEYPESQRRNPFQPDPEVVEPKTTIGDANEVGTRDPLEQFGLGQLSLVAIISEVAVPKAMFIGPDGFGYVVKEGDRVGRNSGVIRDIRDNAVEIIEGGEEDESQTLQRVIKLRELELSVGDDGLTEEERRRLEELLESEAGRQALQKQLQDRAPGANAAESQSPTQTQRPPQQLNEDPRFRGLTPPGGN